MKIENEVINNFGEEWNFFKQKNNGELEKVFDQYFYIFPWEIVNQQSEGFDMGCGSGRWAKFVAPRVGTLNCIEPSSAALKVAKNNLEKYKNCKFECSKIKETTLKENSQDFGYCLGVLHHVDNTLEDLRKCTSLLKKGAPFLIYLYYKFDNRPVWFIKIALFINKLRKIISKFPFIIKLPICSLIAIIIYLPIARITLLLEKLKIDTRNMPLRDYRNKSIYYMMTDSLDRFGTKTEKRFSKKEIYNMLKSSSLEDISFSNHEPFWVAVGRKI